MSRVVNLLLFLLIFVSCKEANTNGLFPENTEEDFIAAVDISSYPEISTFNPKFYDLDGLQKDFLSILKENGVNTARLRLWVNPTNEHSSFDEVKQFSQILKNRGFKIWLTLHYADTWADPGNQEMPTQWQGLDFTRLEDSVYHYTKKVVNEIKPHYIQIGNEINNGILHPVGDITTNLQNFVRLIQKGCLAVRENSTHCQIILHYAGINHANWFFNQLNEVIDYDIIGLSYYPIWHGKSLQTLKSTMHTLSSTYSKKIIIAETAYPFTLAWNDWTNNIVGLNEQIIFPEYPATPDGQRRFIKQLKTLTSEVENGIGFCYWGGELIAWKGNQSTNASPWENQALFDFDNKALPVLIEFRDE